MSHKTAQQFDLRKGGELEICAIYVACWSAGLREKVFGCVLNSFYWNYGSNIFYNEKFQMHVF